MRILHLTEKDYKIGKWSGGTTTELFIYPQGADYAARQFAFRISSAAVDLEESDFTLLEGVVRYITPLSGGFTLTHPGQAAVQMAPMDPPYRFSGEIPTHCMGKATDFNLMLKGVAGSMEICGGDLALAPGFYSFYATEDRAFVLEGQSWEMKAGELLVVFADAESRISLGEGGVIVCRVEL